MTTTPDCLSITGEGLFAMTKAAVCFNVFLETKLLGVGHLNAQ